MTAILSVLQPIAVTDSVLTSSTVAETEYSAWASGTTYAVSNRCIQAHRIYESLVAGNIGNDPSNVANQAGSLPKWLDVGPTNKMAMFDDQGSTQTVAPSPLTVKLEPGFVNSVYLGALDADELTITVKDAPGGTTVFTYSAELEASVPGDYDEWCWMRFKPQTDAVVSGIDEYNDCEVTVTLTKITGSVKCGVLAVGDLIPLGATLSDPRVKPRSNSYVKTNDFGITTIKRRTPATDMDVTALVDRSEANFVLATIQGLLDVPCIWIASESPDNAGLRVYGLGSAELSYPITSKRTLSLHVQGLI